ncbi:MAG: Subtilisin-like protein serine protease-like protein [Streptosporangiaceae bacterium]|jgi:type VII secretion-associated serine protease mycosin|nr:Subtilisin-like protein serine protease-like protein [Streptosporangiaceae bacterium]
MLTGLSRRGTTAVARILAAAAATGLVALAAPPVLTSAARADEIRDQAWPVLSSLEVQRAWNITKGGGVTVAVLDSGVDASQQDLAGSVTSGPDLTKGANPPGVAPKRLHGTNMASIIAGHGHGPGRLDGMIGVAPEAKILSLRVIVENDEPGFRYFNTNDQFDGTIAKGIRYAVDHGVDVINMSLGKALPTKQERQAVAYAISRGVVVVAAAGNEGASQRAHRSGHGPYSFPASFPGVISVAALTAEHRHAGFSNRNSAVVVSAPGVRIVGAGPGKDYWVGDGTSPATAFVSGVAALIRARHPKLAPPLVTQAIVASTAYRPAGGYDSGVGFGEVNAASALEAAQALSRARSEGMGLPPGRRFGAEEAGPVQVVRHDPALLATCGAMGLAGLLGLAGSVLFLRGRRRA